MTSTVPVSKSSATKQSTPSRPKPILARANNASNSPVSLASYSTLPPSIPAQGNTVLSPKSVNFVLRESESGQDLNTTAESVSHSGHPDLSAGSSTQFPTSPSESVSLEDPDQKSSPIAISRFRKKTALKIMRSKSLQQPKSSSAEAPPNKNNLRSTRAVSQTLADLLTCPICLEQLQRPTMLPCQHTFCLVCLQNCVKGNVFRIACPTCREPTAVPAEGVTGFPPNLSILSFIELLKHQQQLPKIGVQSESTVGDASTPGSFGIADSSAKPKLLCHRCKELEPADDKVCLHCCQGFCAGCRLIHDREWKDDYASTLENLQRQSEWLQLLDEDLKARCEKIFENIDVAAQLRIQGVLEAQKALKVKVQEFVEKEAGKLAQFRTDLELILPAILEPNGVQAASQAKAQELLQKLRHYGQSRLTFSEESFDVQFESGEGEILDTDSPKRTASSPTELSIHELPLANLDNANGPPREIKKSDLLVSADDKSLMYRSKPSQPKCRYAGASLHRPAGVAVSPWTGEIYVAVTDSHKVVVLDKQGKVTRCIGQPFRRSTTVGSNSSNGLTVGAGHFLCPFGIAFSTLAEEIYVTDKWLNCIQVFDKDGNHKRKLGIKGTSPGHFRSPEGIAVDANGFIYVCDTCNDRVQILDRDGVFVRELGIVSQLSLPKGERYQRSEFNEPTGIAVARDGSRIAVCDYGNSRIKIYAGNGDKIGDFGFKGTQKGQFMFPECLAMDEQGFIIVADNGNGRIQIFRPNGNFVRLFGSSGSAMGQFNWIAGIALSSDNEIIVSDFKNHCIQIY